jgi:hypothetical protein
MSEQSNSTVSGNSGTETVLKLLATILKEIGITNFIVLFLASFLLFFASEAQKQRFIDTWFLLESDRHVYCTIIIAGIVMLSVIGGIYFKTMHKLSRAENERVGKEKSKLQSQLLGQDLSSSDAV